MAPPTPARQLFRLACSLCATCALALFSDWAFYWLSSGCALESLLILFNPAGAETLQGDVSTGAFLLCLNTLYAVAATSWLLHIIFTAVCWPLVLATCIAQYAAISSFTRGKLRWLLNRLHFFRDKVAFFDFPTLIVDAGLEGFVALRGLTISLLTLSLDFHGVEISLGVSEGHEIIIYTDSLEIKLFRSIAIGEIFAAHKCSEDAKDSLADTELKPVHTRGEAAGPEETQIVEDNLASESKAKAEHGSEAAGDRSTEVTDKEVQNTLLGDTDAEKRYHATLQKVRAGSPLHQKREALKKARDGDEPKDHDIIETRAALGTELRALGLSIPPGSERITSSNVASFFPEPSIFDAAPSILRFILWVASHTHPIECPSISLAASGKWLSELLRTGLFQRHSTHDERILDLEHEICEWLSVGEYCIDLADVTAEGQVSLRTMYDIRTAIRSKGIVASRINPLEDNSTRIASLAGVDATFVLPAYLLPHHSHKVPAEPPSRKKETAEEEGTNEDDNLKSVDTAQSTKEGTKKDAANSTDEEDQDTTGVSMRIRVSLPAKFDESFVSFATTLSKAGQMLDIDGEVETPPSPSSPAEANEEQEHHSVREKLSHSGERFGTVMKHPWRNARETLHREVKKSTVMSVNGAWFAKWTYKLLNKLEGLNGDVGYSTEIPVALQPYRAAGRQRD